MNTPTIIGIGTARGGTKSLARLLQAQDLDVTHEGTTSLPWQDGYREGRYEWTLRTLREQDGDVSFWLTQGARRLLEDLPETKCLVLKRPKADTVESLMATMAPTRLSESRSFHGMVFPTIEGPPEEAWGEYWELYREIAGGLEGTYPDRVHSVGLYDLETEDEQAALAEFLGIDDWTYVHDLHYGQRAA